MRENEYNPYEPNGAPPGEENVTSTHEQIVVPPEDYQYQAEPQTEYVWNYDPTPQKKKRSAGKTVLLVLATTLAAIMMFVGIGSTVYIGYQYFSGNSTPFTQSGGNGDGSSALGQSSRPKEASTADGEKMTAAEVAEKVKPSVVGVLSYNSLQTVNPSSQGSGIIFTKDGYIVTNAHVVKGAVGIEVVLDNGDSYKATLIGADTKTDLAVLKIESDEDLPYAEFGTSSEALVGEDVLAIGNPGGLDFAGSVTKGIVSGVDRQIQTDDNYILNCIQTDAAINPGNSGGALVNFYGQVIGINSSKISSVDYEGMCFAISIDDALPVIENLMQNGYVKGRPYLGISIVEVTDTIAQLNNLPNGLYIQSITQSGSMYQAGARQGDVITQFNGTAIETFSQLSTALDSLSPGDQVTVKLYRSGEELTITFTLDEDKTSMPQSNTAA